VGLSSGAMRLLNLLRSFAARSGAAFPFQRTLATRLGVVIRQVQRYVSELVKKGLIQVKKRQHSSALYFLLPDVASNVASNVASGYPVPIKRVPEECKREEQELVLKKPSVPEKNLPERVQEALSRAAGRIAGAVNPTAYRRSIIERELWAAEMETAEKKPLVTEKRLGKAHSPILGIGSILKAIAGL
jgi:DNA-binding transcriptional MocR family regulator